MDPAYVVFVAVVAAFVAALVVLRFVSPRANAASPGVAELDRAVRVAEASEGALVTVIGEAAPHGETLRSPLAGRECLAWTVGIEEHFVVKNDPLVHDPNGRTGAWREILHDQGVVDFEIADETGAALVRAGFPELTLTEGEEWRTGPLGDAPPQLVAILRAHGQLPTDKDGEARRLRAREGTLVARDRVVVAGLARLEAAPAEGAVVGYRSAPTRLVVVKPPDATLVVANDLDAVRRHGLRRF
jgi:hypothetical protein